MITNDPEQPPVKPRTFEHVYTAYFPPCVRFALDYLKDKEEAQEIADDSVIIFWARSQVEAIDNPLGFLRRTVQNLCRTNNRKPHNVVARVSDDVLDYAVQQPIPVDEWEPSANIFATDFDVFLRAEIEKLSGAPRRVADLLFNQKKTPREIEEILHILPDAQRKNRSRAMAKLRPAFLLYRAQKILAGATAIQAEVATQWLLNGERLVDIAPALGLTYSELGQVIRDDIFDGFLEELRRLKAMIAESTRPKTKIAKKAKKMRRAKG